MFRRAFLALTLSLATTAPTFAAENTSTDDFRVALSGIPVGVLKVEDTRNGEKYRAKSRFYTTGIAGVVRDVNFTMVSRGEWTGQHPDTTFYRENMNTGKRKSKGNFKTQTDDGRTDPNSALLYAISDRPVAQGCGFSQAVFDGKRTNQLTIKKASESGDTLTCTGSFMRTAGYTDKQIAARPGFTFEVTYRKVGNKYRFVQGQSNTDYGRVTVTPR